MQIDDRQPISEAGHTGGHIERRVRVDALDGCGRQVRAQAELDDPVEEVLDGPQTTSMEQDPVDQGQIGPAITALSPVDGSTV